jgi:hypothetical protein
MNSNKEEVAVVWIFGFWSRIFVKSVEPLLGNPDM